MLLSSFIKKLFKLLYFFDLTFVLGSFFSICIFSHFYAGCFGLVASQQPSLMPLLNIPFSITLCLMLFNYLHFGFPFHSLHIHHNHSFTHIFTAFSHCTSMTISPIFVVPLILSFLQWVFIKWNWNWKRDWGYCCFVFQRSPIGSK